jgi:O-antigen/teichoic acid export membrane protein
MSLLNFFDTFIFSAGRFIIKFIGRDASNRILGEFNYVFAPLSVLRVVMLAFFVGFFPYLSKAIGEGDEKLSMKYITKGLLFILIVCSLFTAFFYITGDYVLKLLYGRTENVQRLDFLLVSIFISLIVFGRMGNRILLAQDRNTYSILALLLSVISLFVFPFLFKNLDLLLGTELTLIISGFIYSVFQLIFIFLPYKEA